MLTCLKEKVPENYYSDSEADPVWKKKNDAIQWSSLSTETHSTFYLKEKKLGILAGG